MIYFNIGRFTDAQGSSCPLLGSNIQTAFSQSNRERLFLNFGAPAQCNGTVTSWRYCYYNTYTQSGGDDDDDDDDDDDSNSNSNGNGCGSTQTYTSKFLVYRQTSATTYEPVPGSTRTVTLSLRCPRDGGFRCREETLTQNEQFSIQENDIIAACLMDDSSTNPIRIVGEGSVGSGQVYQYNRNNYESCTTAQLQTVDTAMSSFISQNGIYRLHLYADISSK